MKRIGIFLLVFILAATVFPSAVSMAEYATLKDGITCVDAITVMAAAAQTQGELLDQGSASADGASISMNVKHFRLTAHAGNNGMADSVTLSAGYLDADLAKTMGIIYGMICVHLGGMTEDDSQVILSSIDFNAFNTLEANTQTLILNGYKIIASIVPDDEYCYRLSLALVTSNQAASESDKKTDAALTILQALDITTSAEFLYDESTDANKVLGKPNQYYSKINFALASIDPKAEKKASLSVNQGGSIEVFETRSDAIDRQHKVLSNLNAYFGTSEYSIVCENVLLRLSPNIPLDELGTIIPRFVTVVTGKDAGASADSREQPVSVNVGDIVKFGSYEQDGNQSNGAEPIEWIVVRAEGNTAMLVSVNALDVYNTDWGAGTWDRSTLRTWMNGTFYETAFSSSEKASIVTGNVAAEKNPNYETDPGEDTQDKVFALSYNEAKELLTNTQRRCKPTAYASKGKSVYTDETGNCYWWLRSPGKPGCGASIVCTDGSFDYDVSYDGFCYGMRPAIKIDLAGAHFE